MDVLRRNTDYALRVMVNLAIHYGQKSVSTREVAQGDDIPYQLACKILQKLRRAKLVVSCMGPKGGFSLSREPSKTTLMEIIGVIQGPVSLNRCLLAVDVCSRQKSCTVSKKLAELQKYIDSYLRGITLDELLRSRAVKIEAKARNLRRIKK